MRAFETRRAEDLGYESVWSGEHIALRTGDRWWEGFPADPASPGMIAAPDPV